MKPRLARSRPLAKKSSIWFAPAKWFTLAVTVASLALGVLLALNKSEASGSLRLQSGRMAPENTYVVDSTGDGDNDPLIRGCDDGTRHCTLRAAIQQANLHAGTDDITFNIPTSDPGFNNGTWTINLGKALDQLSGSLNITGPGANQLIVKRNSPTGFRIFYVTIFGIVNLSGLTISGGGETYGGGIYIEPNGTLNVTNSTVSGNTANLGGGIYNNGTATITNSTLSSNVATNSASPTSGGGIYNKGSVTITNSTLSGNGATAQGTFSSGGGGILNIGTFTLTGSTLSNNLATQGGGIYNIGTFTVTSSTISGNTVGAIFNSGIVTITNSVLDSNPGGAIHNEPQGMVNVANSTLSGNSAVSGGGISNAGAATFTNASLRNNQATNGGGISNVGTITITNSTLSGNSTKSGGLGGGGIYNDGTATVTNSTLTGNSSIGSIGGGGIYIGSAGQIEIRSTTISGNSAASGGGIYANGSVGVKSSIIALNSAVASSPDGHGNFLSRGFNLIGNDNGTTGFNAATDQIGTSTSPLNPKFDPNGLRNNGGPTQTIALVPGSPAIDKGSSAIPTGGNLTTDQRDTGFPRTFDDPLVANANAGDGTDIGAFEVQTGAPTPTPTPTPPPNLVQFSSSNYSVVEDCTTVTITVNRIGDTSGAASVSYATSDITATERRDYIAALGRLSFAPGETSKNLVVLINEDSYVEGPETFNVNLSNPSGAGLGAPSIATVQITHDSSEPGSNVIDDPQNFVCQHYHDFLNRQPDTSGLNFWTNEITSCGTNQSCIEAKRINVSAAFYLSIEFQDTGYLVERIYKASYGDASGTSTFGGAHQLAVPIVRLNEFLSDTQEISKGVIVGQGNWQQQLENNKQAFTLGLVQRARFTTAFPISMTAAQFVDKLNLNAGNVLSPSERATAIGLFGGATDTSNVTARAQALRQVAEDADLNNNEFNRAFVLMQFYGYLRRNPNDPQDTDYTGYDFWLTKLNQFNGNFVNAEMVKAFITSSEYRSRFGP